MKILVIGDNCTDRFIYGQVARLSPEAPVPVITPVETVENPGMAGNTKANCKAICPEAEVTLWAQPEQITKTRFVEKKSNHMFIRYDEGESVISKFDKSIELLEVYDIVIVSDYNKGFLSDEDVKNIGLMAPISILDSKRALTQEMIAHYSFVKLNEFERINNNKLEHPGIITTLGAKGAEYQGKLFPSPKPQETIDVSGAGDTFTAAFAIEYVKTKDVEHAITHANELAAQVVSKRGVVTPSETY